jgi:uncharacterized protein (TIGR02246 family)
MDRMKVKRIFVGMVVIAFCIFFLTPIVSAGTKEDAAQLTQEWVKAFHEGNAEALSNLFAQDGVYAGWASPFPAAGREAIKATFAGFIKAYPVRYIMLSDASRQVYGDTAVLYNNWTLVYGDGKGPVKTIFGRNCSVTKVIEGKTVILIQFNSFFPSVGP